MKKSLRRKLAGLYAITDASTTDPEKIIHDVGRALDGGARLIQYRDKSGTTEQRLEVCQAIRKLTKKYAALFIVNDDIELSISSNADGVHLGQNDARPERARERLGRDAIIGISCYNRFELAIQAVKEGADYIAFGSFFPSRTKPDAKKADLSLLQRARQELDIPIAAIGGITAENAKPLIDAGADMLAVVEGVFGQEDVKTAAGRFHALFK